MSSDAKRNKKVRDKVNRLLELGVSVSAIAKGCNEYQQNMSTFKMGTRNMNDQTLDKVERYLSQFEQDVHEILKGED